MTAPNGTPEPPVPATEAPATEAGRRLFAWANGERSDGLLPALPDVFAGRELPAVIALIEAEARAAQRDRVAALLRDAEDVERAIWPDGPASGHGSGAYAAWKARLAALLAPPAQARDTDPGDTES